MKHLIWISILLVALIYGCKKDEKQTTATVTTTTPTNITANSATSGGDIIGNGGSAISKNGICYAMHNNPTVADSVTSDGIVSSGSFSSSLNNLNANMTYYVRAYAINASGTGYGATDSFTTAKGVPTLTTTAVTNNQALTAQSGWTLVNNGGAAITAVGICWSTSPHPTITNSKTSDTITKTSFVDTLTGLSAAVTYYVRAYATSSFGTGYGNEISFTVSSTDVVTDIDGNSYGTVVIGTQTWTTTNLRVTHYQNGDSIINGQFENFDWWGNILNSIYIGAYTYPNFDTTLKSVYGLYYNNYAIDDSRAICPTGWHVPTVTDWQILQVYEGISPSDTSISVFHYYGNTSKFLEGGSSGLNLQLGGEMIIEPGGPKPDLIADLNIVAFYWTSSNPSYTARLGNYYYVFNSDSAPNFPGSISGNGDFTEVLPIRCIKN